MHEEKVLIGLEHVQSLPVQLVYTTVKVVLVDLEFLGLGQRAQHSLVERAAHQRLVRHVNGDLRARLHNSERQDLELLNHGRLLVQRQRPAKLPALDPDLQTGVVSDRVGQEEGRKRERERERERESPRGMRDVLSRWQQSLAAVAGSSRWQQSLAASPPHPCMHVPVWS